MISLIFNFTYKQDNTNYKARVDRIYIKEHDLQKVLNYQIIPAAFSDHDQIIIEMKWGDRPKWGKGTWAMNTQVLDDPHFVEGLKSLITVYKTNKQISNNSDGWDVLKANIKDLAIQTSQLQRKNNKGIEDQLTLISIISVRY